VNSLQEIMLSNWINNVANDHKMTVQETFWVW